MSEQQQTCADERRLGVSYSDVLEGKKDNPQEGFDYVLISTVTTESGTSVKVLPRPIAVAVKQAIEKADYSNIWASLDSKDELCKDVKVNMAQKKLKYGSLVVTFGFSVGAQKRSDCYEDGVWIPPAQGEKAALELDMPNKERVRVVGDLKVHHRFVLLAEHTIQHIESLRMCFATEDGKVVDEVAEFGNDVYTDQYKVQDKSTSKVRFVRRDGDLWRHEDSTAKKEALQLVFVDIENRQYHVLGYDEKTDCFEVLDPLNQRKRLRHYWFAWFYEADEHVQPADYKGTDFVVSCTDRAIACRLEDFMNSCSNRAEFIIGSTEYTAWIKDKMYQQVKNTPECRRRLFRCGTPLRDDYRKVMPLPYLEDTS